MKNILSTKCIAKYCLGITVVFSLAAASVPYAAETWKESFNDICSKTQATDNMSVQELKLLVDRAEKLAPEIQASDEPGKKVYLQRLKKCRSLYEFMIESKQNAGK